MLALESIITIVIGDIFFVREKWSVGLKMSIITIAKKKNLISPRTNFRLLFIGGFVIL